MATQNRLGCFGFLVAIFVIIAVMMFVGDLMRGPQNSPQRATQDVSPSQSVISPSLAAAQTQITKFSWHKGGFDSIMMATFSIKNDGDHDVKDINVRCTHSAPSGTVIDQNEQTIYEIVKAHSTRKFREVNMGFIASQAASSSCEVAGVSLAD
jgi:hypothetical protein